MAQHKRWYFPNLTILAISIVVAICFYQLGYFDRVVESFGQLGVIGVFLSGMFFVSTFSVIPAGALLLAFSDTVNHVLLALVAGGGAVVGDFIAMRFIRNKLLEEINPLLKVLHIYRRINILHSKYFAWLAPVIGAIIIASPFPDEAGLILLGVSKVSLFKLSAIMYLLNSGGIFVLVKIVQ